MNTISPDKLHELLEKQVLMVSFKDDTPSLATDIVPKDSAPALLSVVMLSYSYAITK